MKFRVTVQLFPGLEVTLNYTFFKYRKRIIQFDVSHCNEHHSWGQILIPELSLAFEYNGEYHYRYVAVYPIVFIALM